MEAVNCFGNLYADPGKVNISNQMDILKHFPSFLSREERISIGRPIDVEEIKEALSSFSKDKSLGLDGWSMKFFIFILDIMGSELLEVVEMSRIEGVMHDAINSTFLAPVPKKDNLESFMDYKPIALCNLVYKLVTKIIVMRLKLKLFEVLSKEQCGFLKNR